jgi:hypothetical protein
LVLSPWDEYSVTWNTKPASTECGWAGVVEYDQCWARVNVTDDVAKWQQGSANYGVLVRNGGISMFDVGLSTREAITSKRPYVRVYYRI